MHVIFDNTCSYSYQFDDDTSATSSHQSFQTCSYIIVTQTIDSFWNCLRHSVSVSAMTRFHPNMPKQLYIIRLHLSMCSTLSPNGLHVTFPFLAKREQKNCIFACYRMFRHYHFFRDRIHVSSIWSDTIWLSCQTSVQFIIIIIMSFHWMCIFILAYCTLLLRAIGSALSAHTLPGQSVCDKFSPSIISNKIFIQEKKNENNFRWNFDSYFLFAISSD